MRTDVFTSLVTILFLGFIEYVNTKAADGIVFPDETRPAREVSDPCRDLTYCTVKPKDYPEDKFKELFKDYKALPRPSAVEKGKVEVDFESRLPDVIEMDNCPSIVTYEPLYQVREKREENWRVVIQVPDINFKQEVRMERCENPDTPCFAQFPPSGQYEYTCKQKYINWEVLVVKDNNQTEVIKPEIPVCCSCQRVSKK